MSKVVKIGDLAIGEGKPKICVPIVGITREDIYAEAKALDGLSADLVEWRADWFEEVFDVKAVKEVLVTIREIQKEIPILFTFRTLKEGGEKVINLETYARLNKEIAASGLVDAIDVEALSGDEVVCDIIRTAHKYQVKVIASSHDFTKTPPKDIIVSRLLRMQKLGADIPKIAVMPRNKQDVLRLLEATIEMEERYADRPIVTMSMSGIGTISRVVGEVFGSAITFGSAKKASAPGQMPVNELADVIEALHRAMGSC